MELFGRTFDAQQVAGLVFMLALLALWGNVLRAQLRERRWIKRRQAEMKGAKDASRRPDRGGPWG
ncbi:MAG: hypothetical protein KJ676_06920 [Alphaproteobacteria bacterium]|nr:hypothetical protein [Alphaproteobacteria bacterium]MBU1526236.1 hypothetical protein [Alphaproteobacteria bacterium]MBU2118056.1 hypothetical protein [Alphaproteobacteria bacterium]MBU2351393.1 hypothetical protein [Alphaproteobacteria bacterium]MBU2382085.1 hypothetical protein [Alphaproteobacteria bacterium]